MDDDTRRLVDATMIGEAVESLPLAIVVWDASLNHLAVNAAAAELVGVSRAELLRRRVSDVVALPHRELQQAAFDVESYGLRAGEAAIRREDGSVVEVTYATMSTRIGNLPVLVSFVRPKAAEGLDPLVDVLMAGVREGAADPRG
ncbi:MAG TPA: PAS domain S-box protein [Gaiellaceae bacterium]|nr:PAS domain S-box protein [Gaiellaceae bacterium]